MKNTFASSTELNILVNQEPSNGSKKPNCRVQVLPVFWRQEIQFGVSKEYDVVKKVDERDIGDASDEEEITEDTGNATLQDITVEGLAPIRSLISDGKLSQFVILSFSIIGHFTLLYAQLSRTHHSYCGSGDEPHI